MIMTNKKSIIEIEEATIIIEAEDIHEQIASIEISDNFEQETIRLNYITLNKIDELIQGLQHIKKELTK